MFVQKRKNNAYNKRLWYKLPMKYCKKRLLSEEKMAFKDDIHVDMKSTNGIIYGKNLLEKANYIC